jgi:hypothetical protein
MEFSLQVEQYENIKIIAKLVLGEQPGIFKQKMPPASTVEPTFADITSIVSTR